jgi:hypothetical protein
MVMVPYQLAVQALLHAPLLRNFYLSGSHPYAQCTHRQARPCLSCELVNPFVCFIFMVPCA